MNKCKVKADSPIIMDITGFLLDVYISKAVNILKGNIIEGFKLPYQFRMSPIEDIEVELKKASRIYKIWKGDKLKRTFLTGANPFVLQ